MKVMKGMKAKARPSSFWFIPKACPVLQLSPASPSSPVKRFAYRGGKSLLPFAGTIPVADLEDDPSVS